LCTVCEDLLPEYYGKALLGSQVDQYIFNSLVATFLPEVDQHLRKLGLPMQIISLPWFMCLFLSYIPFKAAFRFLDCFFYDGSDVLFLVGLAVLKLSEADLLAEEDSEKVIHLLRTKKYDCDALIKLAFSEEFKLPIDRINEIRNQQKYQAIRTMEESKKRKQLAQIQETKSAKFSDSELDKIYEQYKSVISPSSPDFAIDMQQGAVLLEKILSKIQSNWWDYVLPKIYKVYDKNQDGKLEFQEFVVVLSIAMKGNLVDRFTFCFKMVDLDDDSKISTSEFVKLLKVLYRIYFREENSSEFPEFVDMTLKKLDKKETDQLSSDELLDLIVNQPLLSTYWNLPSEKVE